MDGGAVDAVAALRVARTALAEAEPDVVLLDGHHPVVAAEVAAWAQARRIPVVLDAGRWKPHFDDLVPLVDELVCSGDFAVPSGSGFESVAAYGHRLGARVVAQTHGPGAIELSVEGRRTRIPVPSVPVVDTLGAGDVLHGAYAYYRADGCDSEESLARAAEVAAFRCRFAGSRTWVGAWAER
jgi:sugar/nucleoside kinase (ribokinase family)